MPNVTEIQREICATFRVQPLPVSGGLKVGIARNVKTNLQPLNALRNPPSGDTSGWYIWRGTEMSTAPEFFVPLHASHLSEWCPEIIPYLALPAGWRVLLAPKQEDVWLDEQLLKTGVGCVHETK